MGTKKTNLVILIVLVFVFALLFGCNSTPKPVGPGTDKNSPIVIPPANPQTGKVEVNDTQAQTICDTEDVMVNGLQIKCYTDLAIDSNNVTLCQNLGDIGSGKCINDFALEKGDASVCKTGLTKYDRDDCYQNMALNYYDTSICARISDPDMVASCIRIVNADKQSAIDIYNNGLPQ